MSSSSNSTAGDTLDCTGALKPCNCTANQVCVQVGRSGTQCAYNTCIDKSNSGSGSGGKSNIGALAGEAVGGVLGALALIVAAYWFWWRRRRNSRAAAAAAANASGNKHRKSNHGNGHLRELRTAGAATRDEKDVTAKPGPGEQDAQPIKRQSLRFDASNSQSAAITRRSLSQGGNDALLELQPPMAPALMSTAGAPGNSADNPFGDHHSLTGTAGHSTTDLTQPHAHPRDSTAESEFSYRSSHSTNIIPIAYIPAHQSSNSISDYGNANPAYGTADRQGGGRDGASSSRAAGRAGRTGNDRNTRHSIATLHSTADGSQLPRSSRLSVPFSLRSTATGLGDSLSGGTVFNGKSAFSALFDRRASAAATASAISSSGNGLEIIASGLAPSNSSHRPPVSPPLPTPTLTRDGKPIRPPRAPGLDLKLPTPDAISPPPLTSPSFPWNSTRSGQSSPAFLAVPPPNSGGARATPSASAGSRRETLADKSSRASAYSTFSQATESTASHLSYILDPPQIVTPVSAGRVEVQVLGRAAAKTVKLPPSASSPGGIAALAQGISHPSTANSSSYAQGQGLNRSASARSATSPVADNPFGDEAAVLINIPGSQENTPTLPSTPTFGTSPNAADTAFPAGRPTSDNHELAPPRDSVMSGFSSRRESDLSIFTSSSSVPMHRPGQADATGASSSGSTERIPRMSNASAAGSERASSIHSSFAGTRNTSNRTSANNGRDDTSSARPSHQSRSSGSPDQDDDSSLEPPRRPFTMSSEASGAGSDSRHTSTALSMRSGYASVLDGIPFNLSLSPEANRHSQASSTGGRHGRDSSQVASGQGRTRASSGLGTARQSTASSSMQDDGSSRSGRESTATFASDNSRMTMSGIVGGGGGGGGVGGGGGAGSGAGNRDTAYSLASEWNGAFAGVPVTMGGASRASAMSGLGGRTSIDEEPAVPALPSQYRPDGSAAQNGTSGASPAADRKDDQEHQADSRYSSDSLAMAAAIARSFDN